MGAVLSLPLMAIPGLGFVVSSVASCFGALMGSIICSSMKQCAGAIPTKAAYALLLLFNSLISWLMLTDWAFKKLQRLTLDWMTITCNGKDCYGFVAVHRMNFALGTFHAAMALLLLLFHSRPQPRIRIQNDFWAVKIFTYLALVATSFFLPDSFFIFWGNYVAFAGAIIFLLIGLVLVCDMAYVWTEYCRQREHEDDSRTWIGILVGSSAFMYVAALVMTVVMYIFFAHKGCSMNQAAITINLLLFLGISVLSAYAAHHDLHESAGLGSAASVALYCTYLTLSAVAMEPDDKNCNPLVRANGTRTASIVLGACMTFGMLAFSTTNAASNFFGKFPSESSNDPIVDEEGQAAVYQRAAERNSRLPSDDDHAQSSQPLISDSQSVVSDDDGDDDVIIGGAKHRRDRYNYVAYHAIFMLSSAWVATLLTTNVNPLEHEGDFVAVGRSYWASWVKIISAWVCYGIYTWSVIAPSVLPDRSFTGL